MRTHLTFARHLTPRLNLGVLWDLDGVLVDTGEAHYKAWAQTCERYAIPFSWEHFRRTFGMNNAGIIATFAGQSPLEDQAAEMSDYKEELFRRAIRGRVQLLPSVRRWLQVFRESGILQAVASSAPLANIDAIVDELDIAAFFGALVSGAEMPGKPEPAVFLEAARRLRVPPEHCLVIEDAVAGVEAARRAGMKCLAVTTTNPRQLLKDADCVLENLNELSWEIVRRLFQE